MTLAPLEERYKAFCRDAEELLEDAGLAREGQDPKLIGRGFYEASVNLALMHFPDDRRLGVGPRGMLWRMHAGFGPDKDLQGALLVAKVLKKIIENRPGLDIDRKKEGAPTTPTSEAYNCPFHEEGRGYEIRDNLVFVLMPFTEPWSDRLWRDHIRECVINSTRDGGLEVQRADDLFGQSVMEDVFEGIVSSRLIVADCTNRNPNVLYELGLAHALGKRTALLSQSVEDIPFDLRRFRFCIYEDNSDGYPKLRHFLQQTIVETFGLSYV